MRSAVARGFIVASCWLYSAPVAGEPTERIDAAISWVRTPGSEACANLSQLVERVNARLGRAALVGPRDAKVWIESTIARDNENHVFRVHIALISNAGELLGTRELTVPGDDCREATDTAALALALMIDPDAGSGRSQDAFPVEGPSDVTPPVIAPLPAPQPARSASRPVPAPEAEPAYWRARLAIGGLISAGQLPGAAPGAFASVRLSPRSGLAGVDVLARYSPPKAEDVRPNVGGSFSATSVAIGGFWAPVRSKAILSIGAGAELAVIAANGYNFKLSNQYRQTWLVSAELAAELALPFADRWALLLRLGTRLPFVRQEFVAMADGQSLEIFKTSAVMADLAVGLAFDP